MVKSRRWAWGGLLLWAGLAVTSGAHGLDRGADGEFDRRESSHFILLQDVDIDRTHGFRGSRRFEQVLLRELEGAHQRLDQWLGLRLERPLEVIVYDPEIFDRRFAGLFKFPAAGFYGGVICVRGDTVVTDRLVRTLHHELVHAALDAARPSLLHPAWLNEGLAEWFEARAMGRRRIGDRQLAHLQHAASQRRLFTLADLSGRSFGRLGPGAAGLAYLQSYAFVDRLARVHGERSLGELIDSYHRSSDLARAVRRTYRADLARLEERYVADLLGNGWR